MIFFNLEDYFVELDENSLRRLNNFERQKLVEFRNTLNSKETVQEQALFVEEWRAIPKNRQWDEEIFGIPEDGKLRREYFTSTQNNQYYKYHRSNLDQYADKGIRDENGNIEKTNKLSKLKDLPAKILSGLKIFMICVAVFAIFNLVIYIGGGLTGQFGKTPFQTCEPGASAPEGDYSSSTFTKTMKDSSGIERKLPGNCWDYEGYDELRETDLDHIYKSEDYRKDDADRGNGCFYPEDFAWETTDVDTNEDYVVNMRWEYCGFYIEAPNYWSRQGGSSYYEHDDLVLPATGGYRRRSSRKGSPRGYDHAVPNGGYDDAYFSWLINQKILVVNPVNGKACICQIGDPTIQDANWGPGLTRRLGGLSQLAIDYLEYNYDDGSIELETYFVNVENPEDIATGPYAGSFVFSNSNGCGSGGSYLIDTTDMCSLAVSMAYKTRAESVGNDGNSIYQSLTREYCPSIAGTSRSCASVVSVIVKSSGKDPDFPQTAGVIDMREYLEGAGAERWEKITGSTDVQLGDICMWPANHRGRHVWMYVGEEAVKRNYPDSDGNTVQGSYSYTNYSKACSAHVTRFNYDRGGYDIYRLKK